MEPLGAFASRLYANRFSARMPRNTLFLLPSQSACDSACKCLRAPCVYPGPAHTLSAWSKWTLVSFFELLIYFNTVLFPSKFYFKLRTFSTLQLGVDRRFQSACRISEQSRAGRPSTPRGFDVGDRGGDGCRGGSPPARWPELFLVSARVLLKTLKTLKTEPEARTYSFIWEVAAQGGWREK